MRASSLFALTLALLIGLGVAVGVRWMGSYVKPEAPKKKEIQVLVAARNLFPGDLIDASWVKARVLKPEEEEHYEANKDKYLPAVPEAAALRVPSRPIEADTPMLKDYLKEMVKPEVLSQRLLPNMRAVNLSLPKDHSAGGLIIVGEWVDVFMTTIISSDHSENVTRTAPIAHRARVIAKRNALWSVFQPLPDDKPVNFTIEVNPYRAALIEFCRANGTLAIAPVSASEQRELEEQRTRLLNAPSNQLEPVLFVDRRLGEYEQEEERVNAMNRGEYTIGNSDLVRIFDLKTPPPPTAEIKTENFSGLSRTHTSTFGNDGVLLANVAERRGRPTVVQGAGQANANSVSGFRFKCPDCEKKKKNKGL